MRDQLGRGTPRCPFHVSVQYAAVEREGRRAGHPRRWRACHGQHSRTALTPSRFSDTATESGRRGILAGRVDSGAPDRPNSGGPGNGRGRLRFWRSGSSPRSASGRQRPGSVRHRWSRWVRSTGSRRFRARQLSTSRSAASHRPVEHPRPFGAGTAAEPFPCLRRCLCNKVISAGAARGDRDGLAAWDRDHIADPPLFQPGPELVVTAVGFLRGNPPRGHSGIQRPCQHLLGQRCFGGEGNLVGHRQPRRHPTQPCSTAAASRPASYRQPLPPRSSRSYRPTAPTVPTHPSMPGPRPGRPAPSRNPLRTNLRSFGRDASRDFISPPGGPRGRKPADDHGRVLHDLLRRWGSAGIHHFASTPARTVFV